MTTKLQHSLQAINLTERLIEQHPTFMQQPRQQMHMLVQVRSSLNRAGFRKIEQAYEYINQNQN